MKKYLEIIKSVMPSDSEIIKNSASDNCIYTVSWPLKNDPLREHKRSKTIAIVISREATDDFEHLAETMKENALTRLSSILTVKLSTFDPNHNESVNTSPPVEKWVITSAELLG